MNKLEAVERFPGLREGMLVRGSEGEKLGRILVLDGSDLTVEKGIIFPKDFRVEYDDILGIDGGDLLVNRTRASLEATERPAHTIPIGAAAPYEHIEHTQIIQGGGDPTGHMISSGDVADMDMDTPISSMPKEHPERPEIEPDPEMFTVPGKGHPAEPRRSA